VLCSLLWVTLLGQGVGLGDPQRSLPTPTMLGFCDSVTKCGCVPAAASAPHSRECAWDGLSGKTASPEDFFDGFHSSRGRLSRRHPSWRQCCALLLGCSLGSTSNVEVGTTHLAGQAA